MCKKFVLFAGTTSAISESPWKPKRHVIGSNVFTPKNKFEELILVILLSGLQIRNLTS